MARRKSKYFWHTPSVGWHTGGPEANSGVTNVGRDIVVMLLDTEAGISDRPEQDRFVVERIVGQYMFSAVDNVPSMGDLFLHHRVYVADSDQTAIAIRDLATEDDAETSWLWHQVEYWPVSQYGHQGGGWDRQVNAAGLLVPTPSNGRHGHFDIRVGRLLEGGQSLIWHTQAVKTVAGNDVADGFLFVKHWIRLLCKEL